MAHYTSSSETVAAAWTIAPDAVEVAGRDSFEVSVLGLAAGPWTRSARLPVETGGGGVAMAQAAIPAVATQGEGHPPRRPVPDALLRFLDLEWKPIMYRAYRQRGEKPEHWRQVVGVVETLANAAQPDATVPQVERALRMLPRLRRARPAVGGAESDTVLGLERWMADRLSTLKRQTDHLARGESDAPTRRPNPPDRQRPGAALDPGLPVDAAVLMPGQWVEFSFGTKRFQGKLSWRSQVSSHYLFVDQKGMKLLEIAEDELSARLYEGSARLVAGVGSGRGGKAFRALLGKLQTPPVVSAPRAGGKAIQ